ncbi:retrovirus-related pol polyprotein from transposon TNT 1-94 [Tanacetum coccineum]|uniref:Retrovirus-related pol polyprotein from transposon TNT 1-94 n=1 Tax=Tanacetum coccineum TaxID=301880 RepID=A0ABQ5BQN4_9ASTR
MNFQVFQLDVNSAILNGKLKEEVYVKQSPGFESNEFPDYVCKFNKALYGLKQAPRAWYETLLHSSFRTSLAEFEKLMTKKFEMSMMEELTYFLGLQIKQDDKGISISQEKYTRDLLKKANPKESHLIAVKRILRYLKGTLSLGLWYPKCSGFNLKGCSDSDYVVAMSSPKAEYVDVVGCCANIMWMKSKLNDYDIYYKMVLIFCDNTSAIAISNNPVFHSRTKHIDIRYHLIRDHILKGDIKLHFIPTEYQLADIFIKPLDEPTFTRLKAELGKLNID